MGFLEEGAPLSWEASARYRDVVKRRGVREFLQLYKQFSADVFPKSTLSWGDEIEYCLLNLDVENKVARLYLGAEGVLGELKTRENLVANERCSRRCSDSTRSAMLKTNQDPPTAVTAARATAAPIAQAPGSAAPPAAIPHPGTPAAPAVYPEAPSTAGDSKEAAVAADAATAAPRWPWQMSSWHPEYGTHMIEAIPGTVYPLQVNSILDLLPSMQVRRKKVQAVLPPGCYVASVGSFPTMGAPECRPRPFCCCMRFSPSCCCLRAAGREDTSAKEGAAGVDDATCGPAAREISHPIQRHGAVTTEYSAVTCRHPAVGVTATSAVSAATDTAADAMSPGAANVAAAKVPPAEVAVAAIVSATIQGTDDSSPAAAVSSPAAAYPFSSSAETDDEEGKADASFFRGASGLLSHVFPNKELLHTVGDIFPQKEVMPPRDLVSGAEARRAVLAAEGDHEATVDPAMAASQREEQRAEREEQATVAGGEAADVGKQAAKHGHFRHATNPEPTDDERGRGTTAAAAAEEARSSPFLALVGVTAHRGDFASPPAVPDPIKSRSRSLFVGDALINPHPRFGTLTANIRERRGKKVEILIPLFVDENTALPSWDMKFAMNLEQHIPAAPTICGCASTCHFAADKTGVTNEGVAEGEGGARAGCVAEAAEGEKRARGTGTVATVSGEGSAEGTAEAGAGGPVSADFAGVAPSAAGGSSLEKIASSADETRSREEYYRQLMLEGKILHDGKFIYMDAMGFGMGMHCVQATFGCPSMRDARYLYDQLAVLAPLWLSLSAATPFMRGLLAAVDSRWDAIAACVDCRTDAEKRRLPKSRYGTVSLYISDEAPLTEHLSFYNDVPAPVNDHAFADLVENGVDEILARHMAFLFVRDPLVIFKDKLLAQKPFRVKKGLKSASVRGNLSAVTHPLGGGAATGVPTASATCATTNTAPAPTSTSVPGAAVVAVSPTSADAGSPCTTMSVLRPPPLTTLALTTACSTGQPLRQQREAAEQEEQPRLIHHKEEEEAGEDDTAVVAEAGAPWGIDDGTVYTTTQDFENLQSTNWNSVRFKPPAAFKPWTVSATPPSPADACEREQGSVLQKSRESNSRTGMNSRRSNGRKWSCGSNNDSRRRRTYQEVEVVGPGGAAPSGGVREEREGCLDRLGVASNGESTRGKSLANTVATQPVGIAESATACLLGGGSGRLATPAAVGSGQAGATAAGKDGPGRPSLGVKKLTTHAEGVEEGAAAESSKKTLPPTPGEDSSLLFSSLFASSPTSVPSSSASPSTAAAATENCCASPWRVEFRTPDVQLTDFENVACLSLVSVLVQVILEERLDLYLPMSLNDENKRRAVECNSILRQKFWFRNDVRHGTADRSFGEFSLHQILFGVSASRVSDASPLQMQRDSSSSTRLSSASSRCRSPFSLSASNSVIHYSFSGSPFVPSPVSSLTSYAAAHPHTPHCSPASPSCTPTVTLPPAKPDSTVSSPGRASSARLRPPPLWPQASPGGLPGCFPPLLHMQDIGVDDEYSVSAPTLSAAARTPFDVVPAASLASTCPGSSRSAASAPAPVRVRTPLSCHTGAGGVRVGLDTTLTRAPLSVASSLPGPFPSSSLPPSMSPFVGLVPLCLRYIEKEVVAGQCSCEAAAQYLEYFDFLRHRTEGRVPTDASFLRACLAVHPAYNQDSVISTQACFDLCQLAVKLGHGEFQVPELFGPFAGRAGMRVSADSCEFNNGVPVVTASFLSQFVSDTLKEMLCGYVVEAPEGRWQQEIEQGCAHKRWGGATEGKDGTALGSEKPYIREETRATATAASTETHIVTQEGEAVADPGGQEGTGQGLDQKRATTSGTDCKVLNNGGAEGEAACNTVPRDEGAAIKGSARLRNDIVTIQRSKKDTPAGQQVPLGKKPASDLLTYQPAGTCSKTTSAVEMVGNTQELSRGSGAGNGESDGGTAGQPLYKEATVCRASSKPLACRSVSPTNSRDGNIPQEDNGSGDTNKLSGERENSAIDPKKGGEGFSKDAKAHNDNEELEEDLEGKENEDDGSERIFGNQNSSTVSRRNCATTEGKVRYLLQLDGGLPSRLQEKSTVDSVDLLTTAAPAGSARTTGEEDFPWSATRNAAAPTDADTPAQLKVGVKNTPSCKLAAAAACRGPPSVVALSGSSFAREAGHGGARVYFKEEKADRRIVFALSGKAAASLCYSDTVSTLRSYMSDPLCRSSGEAGSCAPAASAVAGAGKKRSCNMYSGWPAFASVGVTNEEATGLWLFLTSGVHYNWCCDDSGSTSCPSTDDDRESADEVCSIPRLLFSSGEVMAYSKAVLDASA